MSKPKPSGKKLKAGRKTTASRNKREPVNNNLSTPSVVLHNNDGIAKSKQLVSKLQNRKRPAQRARKKNTEVKICGNGLIMPSLEDLEKMFEDSDDDEEALAVGTTQTDSPPAKKERIKFSKSRFNAKSAGIAKKLKNDQIIGNGSDSDTTVTYEVPTNISNESHRFSPLPSTSKDSETFLENDKRYNNSFVKTSPASELLIDSDVDESISVTENNNIENSHSSIKDDVEVIENPCETIVLDDEGNYKVLPKRVSKKQSPLKDAQSTPINIEDDCFIEPPKINKIEGARLPSPILIDDVYSSVDINESFAIEDCEIIDVDEVIAENNAVLEKYSKNQQLNTVTHVVPEAPVPEAADDNLIIVNNPVAEHNYSSSIVPHVISEPVLEVTEPSVCTNAPNLSSRINEICRSVFDELESRPLLNQPHHLAQESRPYMSHTTHRNPSGMNRPSTSSRDTVNTASSNHPNSFSCLEFNTLRDMINERNNPSSSQSSISSEPINISSPVTCRRNQPTLPNTQPQQSPQTASETRRGFGDCPICMEALGSQAVVATICGHIFCKVCIEAAMQSTGKRCPTCRKQLKAKNSYHQLFL